MNEPNVPVVEVEDLRIAFGDGAARVEAVRGISFRVMPGETLAIVGESGSGKSVTAMALTRLLPEPPARVEAGALRFRGREILAMAPEELRKVRGGGIAYVFQEPSSSLNPVFTLRSQIGEAIRLHRPEVRDVDAEIVRWLDRVGIPDPAGRLRAYPHELSGGMQQRAMIAMALSCNPALLVADEPTTALDVTTQAQILDQMLRLRRELGMAVVLITHNFGIVKGFADRVAVMFRGRIVEQGETAGVLADPQHPYTRALIGCIPKLGERRARLPTIDHAALAAEG